MLTVIEPSLHPDDIASVQRFSFEVFECWHGSDMVMADALQRWLMNRGVNLLYSSVEGEPVRDGDSVETHPWAGWALVYRGHVAWLNIGCNSTRELLSVTWRSIFRAVAIIDVMAGSG